MQKFNPPENYSNWDASTSKIAKDLHCSRSTAYKYKKEHKGKPNKTGRKKSRPSYDHPFNVQKRRDIHESKPKVKIERTVPALYKIEERKEHLDNARSLLHTLQTLLKKGSPEKEIAEEALNEIIFAYDKPTN